jgi:hypothetical protein
MTAGRDPNVVGTSGDGPDLGFDEVVVAISVTCIYHASETAVQGLRSPRRAAR